MDLNKKSSWKKDATEVLDPTRLVEDYGYVSSAERIRQLMLAGERLQTARAVEYDTLDIPIVDDDGIPNTIYRPDLFDGQKMMERRALRAQKRRDILATQKPVVEAVVTPSELATAALDAAGTPAPTQAP